MKEYGASTYGDRIADVYDTRYPPAGAATVDLLAELAAGGAALELGIGTGRIALPLAARGVTVHGIDASEAMVRKLSEKRDGDKIAVTLGDFGEFSLDRRFSLVFVTFNTFFALPSQEQQVRCFRAVAEHLVPGGCFLIEAFVPDPARFDRDQRISVRSIETDAATLELARHDPLTQRVESHIVELSARGTRLYPVQLRYAWPAELDLMAQLAGLTLWQRWADWKRQPFTASSPFHISVYRSVTS